ncbi:glycerate kinase [Salipaludibacillus sp. CUR1]|uniref:glycerate kinase family protein n=1 Tax=Salipaludibacillus sp. CUR1 TaxID=2820003 RepID=UPI001E5BD149|nr:glycerate kinase [Salipaludibacillus sp. CUR1]MCE7791616.1 glycerate kinase [Salipaludibacillus sp. CUR1]
MKVILAPDSFKESLTAMEVADSIKSGIQKVWNDAEIIKCPMADGGEGTVQSLVDATGGRFVAQDVQGPLGDKTEAFFGILGDEKTAVIEMASASGIHLVPNHSKDPKITTTYGTGELIKAALDLGVKKFIIGIGGSATNDGGSGMFQALGGSLLDYSGNEIAKGGLALKELATIDTSNLDPRLKDVKIRVACDVDNSLTGSKGASAVYGPQKGATDKDILLLDEALAHYAALIKSQLGKEVETVPGAGAAGGLGAGFLAFMPATLERGGKIVTDVTGLESFIQNADLVITGEGGINHQTIYGKTPVYVAEVAKKYNVPVIAICGSVCEGYESVYEAGIDAVFSSLSEIVTFEDLPAVSKNHLKQTAENVARLINLKIHPV